MAIDGVFVKSRGPGTRETAFRFEPWPCEVEILIYATPASSVALEAGLTPILLASPSVGAEFSHRTDIALVEAAQSQPWNRRG